jgi:hypothetical protein
MKRNGWPEKCKDCLYWSQDQKINIDNEWGACEKTKSVVGDATDATTNAWCYNLQGLEDAILSTHAEFGCVQFKNRRLAVMR